MKIEILQVTPKAETLIEEAGRTCYDSSKAITETSAKKFVNMLLKRGHESVMEHAVITYRATGISRALTHQLVRHRLSSYSQRSQRYVSEKQFKYITPPSISADDCALQLYTHAMAILATTYENLLATGVKQEDARFILPNACETEIVVTMNFRTLRNFFDLRLDSHAQWEIRDMADEILNQLLPHAPTVFAEFSK